MSSKQKSQIASNNIRTLSARKLFALIAVTMLAYGVLRISMEWSTLIKDFSSLFLMGLLWIGTPIALGVIGFILPRWNDDQVDHFFDITDLQKK